MCLIVVEQYVRKKKNSYDFLTKAVDRFKEVKLKLCRRMIKEETFPKKFKETMLHQIQ